MTTRKHPSSHHNLHLAAEQARTEALLTSIGEGVIATDEEGKIMKINDAALDLLGFEEEDLLGKWYLQTMHAYDLKGKEFDPLSRPIMRSLLEGIPVTASVQYRRKDGSKFPVNVTAAPIILEGKPIGTIQVFRDITREQQIDKAKTEFVSLASHQLRTPLTAMRWYLEMILREEFDKLSPEQYRSIKEVYEVNLRLIELVRALLSVARIELGKLSFAPQSCSIEQLAKKAIIELKPQIIEKNLHFIEEYDPTIPQIPLDPDMMHVIFQNLLTNAVKYTLEDGNIWLKITHNRKHILIEVRDDGYGIPKDQQAQLFTKLFRADNARSNEPDGTGLGLYIVESIVQESNGKIWFESEENVGTTFFVRLPVKGMAAREGTSLRDEYTSHQVAKAARSKIS